MFQNLPVGTRIAWGADTFRASSHGVIVSREIYNDRVLYAVDTWDGYTFGVYASEIERVLDA